MTASEMAEAFRGMCRDLEEFYTPDEALEWMFSGQDLLAGRVPVVLIALERADKVRAVIEQLQTGAYV